MAVRKTTEETTEKTTAENAECILESVPPDPNERVHVYVDSATFPDNDPNLLVSVNGVNWVIPKDEDCVVPAFVRDEVTRATEARKAFNATIRKMANATRESAKAAGLK